MAASSLRPLLSLLLTSVLAQQSLADFQNTILAGLQAQGLTQSTAVIASLSSNSNATALIQKIYSSSNDTACTFYAPTNDAWAAANLTGLDLVSTLAYHFAGSSINPSYVTPNYTVVNTAGTNPLLPASNGTASSDPLVVVQSSAQLPIVMGSNYNATALTAGGPYGVQVVPIDKLITPPPVLSVALTQDLIPRAVNSTVNTNFTSLVAFLESFGYLKQFEAVNKGFTIFAPTDAAFQESAAELAALSDKDKAIVAMNHVFQGVVLYSPILAGSAQLSSSSGGRLSWCRDCGNSTGQDGLSLLVVGTNISAPVLRTDVMLANGVLHVIDRILLNTKNNTKTANQAPTKTSTTTKASTATSTSTGVSQAGAASPVLASSNFAGSLVGLVSFALAGAAFVPVACPPLLPLLFFLPSTIFLKTSRTPSITLSRLQARRLFPSPKPPILSNENTLTLTSYHNVLPLLKSQIEPSSNPISPVFQHVLHPPTTSSNQPGFDFSSPTPNAPLTTQPPGLGPPSTLLKTLQQHGLPISLPPLPTRSPYNYTNPQNPVPSTSVPPFIPPSVHPAYASLRQQPATPSLPPLPRHAQQPSSTPNPSINSFESFFTQNPISSDDNMLTNKAFGFGSFLEPEVAPSANSASSSSSISPAEVPSGSFEQGSGKYGDTLAVPTAGVSSDFFDPCNFDLGNFFEQAGSPTPNLDYSPLSSFSASPEWGSTSLFGDAGVAAGVVDDSPPVRTEDSFDFTFNDLPLFGSSSYSHKPADPLPPDFTSLEASLAHPSFDSTFSLPLRSSPVEENVVAATPQVQNTYYTPVVAPSEFFPSPGLPFDSRPLPPHSEPSTTPSTRPIAALRRSTAPTGHRKGVAVDQLLGLDAPTQQRNYVSESSTSKKKIPAAFEGRKDKETKKQRKGSKASASTSTTHDVDEPSLDSTTNDIPTSLEDAIAAKRRNNTIAARRSRHRKLAHLQGLTNLVDILGEERDTLLRFAQAAMAMHPELMAMDGWGEKIGGLGDGSGAMGTTAGEEEARRMMSEAFGEEED